MKVVKITDHDERAAGRLLEQYKAKPRVRSLLLALCTGLQGIEDSTRDVFLGCLLVGNPIGAQLDGLGRLYDVPRGGLDDDTYLVLILGTIAERHSDGTPATLVEIARRLFRALEIFLKTPTSPGGVGARATVSLGVGSPAAVLATYPLIQRLLMASVSAGVSVGYLSLFTDSAHGGAFSCAGRQPWVRGYASLTNPRPGGKGGGYARLLYSHTQGQYPASADLPPEVVVPPTQ